MRALHALAGLLGTTVAVLAGSLSAQEFARWQVWMDAERAGPGWEAARHAELLAAAYNAGNVKRKDGRLFTTADFMPPDPWAPPLTPEQQQARQQAEFEALQRAVDA